MSDDNQNELITQHINLLTERVSKFLLAEFLSLPDEDQLNVVLIKSAQLLLANILCQVASTTEELQNIAEIQGDEMNALINHCAIVGFADKFVLDKH